jgi:Acetyltransferase (GNAT) domain
VVPPEIAKKLPHCPLNPATLLGRLAVDERHHGEGIGEFLFMDALHRSRAQSGQIAAVAVLVEAIDEQAERFYQHFGFIPFPTITGRLFIMMKTVKQLFAQQGSWEAARVKKLRSRLAFDALVPWAGCVTRKAEFFHSLRTNASSHKTSSFRSHRHS